MSTSGNRWLYAIVPADREPPPGVSGVAGEPLRKVCAAGVAAVVGTVPGAEFEQGPLQDRFEDLAWLEQMVRGHHRVIDAVARTSPLLPVRFATIYHSDQRVASMLRERGGKLLRTLGQLAGRSEWGVKVYADLRSTDAFDGASIADEQHPGTAYLLRRKAQQEDRHRALRQAGEEAQQVHVALAATAAASTCHPLQTSEASGRREPMVLNGAYLIEDDRRPALEAKVDALAADHPRLRLEVTGPWPPYSFSDVGSEPEANEP